jgi:enoyl-[acyl-carrier protein] reductase/trans-2-enoyl-CoA reductase (NAD+)
MIIEPKIRGNVCFNAHPVGCERQVQQQINYVQAQGEIQGPKKVLVIGSSNGYGLAARIVSAFGSGAGTIGVAYERPGSGSKSGSAGWYNNAAFEKKAREDGLIAHSVNGDAFTDDIKTEVIDLIKQHMGRVDLVIYSIAAPRRIDPATGEIHSSVIKPIGDSYTARTVDFLSGRLYEIETEPALEEEVEDTVKVMGGEDWKLWIDALDNAGVLADGITTVAFSYIGPELTAPIYSQGTIGRAKEHLEATASTLQKQLSQKNGQALVSINKALVTRASAVIPAVPLYISLLYQVMKEKKLHEGCIQQMYRMFNDRLYSGQALELDDQGRIRLDDYEMRPDVQQEVEDLWHQVSEDNLESISDIKGFREEFLRHHGFGIPGVDYSAEVEV